MEDTPVKINVNFRIVPFGHISIELKTPEPLKNREKKEFPVYTEPRTTNPEVIEIIFGGENYTTPKTTGGIF